MDFSVSPPEIITYLGAICDSEKKKVDRKLLAKISRSCDGSLGHAISMLDTVFTTKGKKDLSLLDTIYFSDQALKPLFTILIDETESGPAKWKKISAFLKKYDGNPEEARRSIAGYLNKVLLNKELSKSRVIAQRALVFTESLHEAGPLGLTLACYNVCMSDDVPF